jgi:hypothetical protein
MKLLFNIVLFSLFALLWCATNAYAEDTPVSVSVLSNDAKFVGSSMGGMRITIRDVISGELLAEGLTVGSTGDTKRIMDAPRERDFVLRTKGSARFDAVLDLERPTRVRIEATGPLAQAQGASEISETWTLLPGKDYSDGNGILLHLHGMVVDVLSPPAHLKTESGNSIRIEANVTKMCGCPLGKTTPWPIERYSVEARLYRATGKLLDVVPLAYTGERSQFAALLSMPGPGAYEIIVTAFDPATKDSGSDATTVILVANKSKQKMN